LVGGATLNGSVARYLDQLAEEIGADWWIQDGALYFVTSGQPSPGVAMLVSPETGLISSPKDIRKEQGNRVLGVKWEMLLQPDFRPGQLVSLRSADYNGYYVAQKVKHQGDNWDDAFYTEVEAKQRVTAA